MKVWGRPPGLRGSPWTRSLPEESWVTAEAGQGAGRRPGGLPHVEKP